MLKTLQKNHLKMTFFIFQTKFLFNRNLVSKIQDRNLIQLMYSCKNSGLCPLQVLFVKPAVHLFPLITHFSIVRRDSPHRKAGASPWGTPSRNYSSGLVFTYVIVIMLCPGKKEVLTWLIKNISPLMNALQFKR